MTRELLYFEDLEVGQRFRSGAWSLDAEQVRSFARQFDPQPFHLDAEAAEDLFFGQLVASGWHTAAISMRLMVEALPLAGGAVGAGGEIRWPRPTPPDSVLRVECEIVEIRPASRGDRGWITLKSETINQDNEVVQVLTAKLVVPRRTNREG